LRSDFRCCIKFLVFDITPPCHRVGLRSTAGPHLGDYFVDIRYFTTDFDDAEATKCFFDVCGLIWLLALEGTYLEIETSIFSLFIGQHALKALFDK